VIRRGHDLTPRLADLWCRAMERRAALHYPFDVALDVEAELDDVPVAPVAQFAPAEALSRHLQHDRDRQLHAQRGHQRGQHLIPGTGVITRHTRTLVPPKITWLVSCTRPWNPPTSRCGSANATEASFRRFRRPLQLCRNSTTSPSRRVRFLMTAMRWAGPDSSANTYAVRASIRCSVTEPGSSSSSTCFTSPGSDR
jgi:hypothetical protein